MTVTDFQSLKAAVIDANHLSKTYFAEDVSYKPRRGPARVITVKISQTRDSQLQDYGDEESEDRLEVTAKRDPVTGIDRPSLQDEILRDAAHDPDQRPYLFTDEILSTTGVTHWILVFARHKDTGRGVQA